MKKIEETPGPLDKLANSRETLKTLLNFGVVVAEVSLSLFPTINKYEYVSFEQLHPIAKLVVGLCTKAWEVCILDFELGDRFDTLCSTSRKY